MIIISHVLRVFQERLSVLTPQDEKLNNHEAAALVKHKDNISPDEEPPTPPVRHDSKNLFKPLRYDAVETHYESIETRI